MRILFFTLFGLLINCFGMNLKITKVYPQLDIYVLADEYVLKADRRIQGKAVGSDFELNMDLFYEYSEWEQDVEYTKTKHSVQYKEKDYIDYERRDGDDEDFKGRRKSKMQREDKYEEQHCIATYRINPLGIVNSSYTLDNFNSFIYHRNYLPLSVYSEVKISNHWFSVENKPFHVDFTKNTLIESNTSLSWLLNRFDQYKEYNEKIIPVYDKLEKDRIVGFLYSGYKRKVFLYDYVYSWTKLLDY